MIKPHQIFLSTLVLLVLIIPLHAAEKLVPGEAIDFEPLAFYPERWKENNVEMKMYPWVSCKRRQPGQTCKE